MKNIIYVILFLVSNIAIGQTNVDFSKKNFKNNIKGLEQAFLDIESGNQYYLIGKGAYIKALPYYLSANNINENNSELNFKIAMCYLFSDEEENAIKYFLLSQSLEEKDKTTSNYYLALAYQRNYQTQKAIDTYKKFEQQIPFFKKKKWKNKVEKRIYECENYLKFSQNMSINKVSNLGEEINTEYSEHNPVVCYKNELVFTSRKKENNPSSKEFDNVDFQPFEGVYIFDFDKNKEESSDIKYKKHDALVSWNNEKPIIYYSKNGGDLYFTQKDSLVAFSKKINSPFHESSAVLSNDGNTIYFTSNKYSDNYDIYYSTKNDKEKWSASKKLSKTVNTKYNEKGLFLHPNGRTLYFASKGHNSMGGYDIFSTTMQSEKNEWSQPLNLGCQINSPDDDLFFTVSEKEKIAYFASNRKGGFGKMDIYKTEINEHIFNMNIIKIIVKDIDGKLVDGIVHVFAKKDNQFVVKSNTIDGELQSPIAANQEYTLVVNAKNYMLHIEDFKVEEQNEFNEIILEVVLKKASEGDNLILSNVEFNYASAVLKPVSFEHLDLVVIYLLSNPKFKIEISGHTDNTGDYDDNKKLSEQRAKAVVDYLIKKNISEDRLNYNGYSSDKPIADNNTPEGREKNRRVEFQIIKK